MNCDLCERESEYNLCQDHMDDMRFPDVFETKDGDYPDKGFMVLFNFEGDTYIGGYSKEDGWFSQCDTGNNDQPECSVTWCYLPDLIYLRESLFKYTHGEKMQRVSAK